MQSQTSADIGQLLWVGFEGTEVPAELTSRIAAGQVGAVITFARNLPRRDADRLDLAGIAAQNAALGLSAPDGTRCLVAVDQEGGVVQRVRAPATRWPPMLQFEKKQTALGTVASSALAHEVGVALGRELRALGYDIDFAPVLDIHTNAANPIIGDRAFGTTPENVIAHALPFAAGLAQAGLLACGKHFPGHGDTVTDSHLALPVIEHALPRLRAVELAPFAAAARAQLPMLMTAHVMFRALDAGVPATLSSRVMTDLLRTELGYQGVIVSDDLDMKAIADHFGIGAAAVGAIAAGCDALLLCRNRAHQAEAEAALHQECGRSAAFATRVQQAAARVRAMKHGLVAQRAEALAWPAVVGCTAHQALAAQLAAS